MATRAELLENRDRLHKEWKSLSDERVKLLVDNTGVPADDFAARDAAHEGFKRLTDECTVAYDKYLDAAEAFIDAPRAARSSDRFGLLDRFLGPLPIDTPVIDMLPATQAKVRSYRAQGAALAVAAAAFAVLGGMFLPWLRHSLVGAVLSLFTNVDGETSVTIGEVIYYGLLTLLMVAFAFFVFRPEAGRKVAVLDSSAADDERNFRAGAQSWTWRQRVYSCAVYSLGQFVFIFFPVAIMVAFGLVGTVLMVTYLREFKRSGSQELSTIASAKLNAAFCHYAVILLVIIMTAKFVFSVIAL